MVARTEGARRLSPTLGRTWRDVAVGERRHGQVGRQRDRSWVVEVRRSRSQVSGVRGEESGCSGRSDLEAFPCLQCRPLSGTKLCGATSGSSHLPLPTPGHWDRGQH